MQLEKQEKPDRNFNQIRPSNTYKKNLQEDELVCVS